MRSHGTGTRGVLRALAPDIEPANSERARREQLVEAIPVPNERDVWLLMAVLGRRLATVADAEALTRVARRDGLGVVLARLRRARRAPGRWLDPPVDVVADGVLVDVHELATSKLSTGVQRVSRNIADQWIERAGVQLVGWSPGRAQLRTLDHVAWKARRNRGLFHRRAIVPVGGLYVLPEVVTDTERTLRVHALASLSDVRTALVGADAIPLTTAETTGPRMPGVFAKYLAAAARMDVVATISHTAEGEYRGWRAMLASAGLPGPDIVTVMLADGAAEADPVHEAEATRLFVSADAEGKLPLVLCVGSHEPRKNHLAVLHAAELLWRAGERFSLAFVGGNGWNSEEFFLRVAQLKKAERPVAVLSGVPDGLLWWAYRIARLTVFPSLNEGFGLPVSESLASGTPVVTSAYGSMAEIAADGGCVLVDPRDDASIAEGIRSLLEDDELHAKLTGEARSRPVRSWQEYADDLWNAVMP